LLPGDDAYDTSRRLFFPRFEPRPAFVVKASGPADVVLAVNFARENGLLLAIKGGGHSDFGVSGHDDAMMLDLGLLNGVHVDVGGRRAWVAGATTTGLIDHETGPSLLAVPLGGTSTVGVGGLALGGGFGKLARRYGLTLDSVRTIDLVCADGRMRRASASENPDLFWGLRGGGGNFGIATSLELDLHTIPKQVLAGTLTFPFTQLREVMSNYGDLAQHAHEDLYVELLVAVRSSAEESLLQLNVCYSGNLSEAERALRPLRQFGSVVREDVKSVSYPAAQGAESHAIARKPARDAMQVTLFRSAFLPTLGNTLAATLVASLEPHPVRRISMLFLHGGGEIAQRASGATAFSNRTALHDMIFVATWPKGAEEADHAQEMSGIWKRLYAFTDGFYVNDMAGGVTPTEVVENYGANAARLVALKTRWDPLNLFRLNANILPRSH